MHALKQQALQARSAGQPEQAAELWRAVLTMAPTDWPSALELAADLRASYHYPEADAQFRRAARSMPDDAWLAHYGGLYTFHADDLAWLEGRGRALLRARPGDADVHRLLADILLQRRRWTKAARHLANCPEADKEGQAKHALAVLYARLAAAPLATTPPYEMAVLNLDRSPDRLRRTRQAFRTSPVPMVRIPGVVGSRLPGAAAQRLGGAEADRLRGTLGCFLSHGLAWETMLSRGLRQCLIIEDDVVPLIALPAGLGSLGLPDGYDICFVNERLQPRWAASRVAALAGFECVTLGDALQTFPPGDNAPGMDGYVLSAAGARKLIAWVEADGFAHDVDWRVLAYGLTAAEIARLSRQSHAWTVLDALRHGVGRADRLAAYVLHPALIRSVAVTSDREDDDRKGHHPAR